MSAEIEIVRLALIKEAAELVRNEGYPSAFVEDYQRKVPVWVLKLFCKTKGLNCHRGNRLKHLADILLTHVEPKGDSNA